MFVHRSGELSKTSARQKLCVGDSSKQPAIDVGPISCDMTDSVLQGETIAMFDTLVLTTG